MGKLFFWIVVILVGLTAARILARHNERQTTQRRNPGSGAIRSPDDQGEPMVRCAHCGIHLPRSEAVLTHGKTWCSTEHARLGNK